MLSGAQWQRSEAEPGSVLAEVPKLVCKGDLGASRFKGEDHDDVITGEI